MRITLHFTAAELHGFGPQVAGLLASGLTLDLGVVSLSCNHQSEAVAPMQPQAAGVASYEPAPAEVVEVKAPAKRSRQRKPKEEAGQPASVVQTTSVPGPVLPVPQPIIMPGEGSQPGTRVFPPAPDPASSNNVALDLSTGQYFSPFASGNPVPPAAAFAPQPAAFPVPQPVIPPQPVQQAPPQFNAANVRGFAIQAYNSKVPGSQEAVTEAIQRSGLGNLAGLTDENAGVFYTNLRQSLQSRGVPLG